MISDNHIEKLKNIYQEEFGIELTDSEALEVAIKIITGPKRVAEILISQENKASQ